MIWVLLFIEQTTKKKNKSETYEFILISKLLLKIYTNFKLMLVNSKNVL